ncbi:ABC transporter ATP-binding protein [bacterium]|nr:ABC transporter ATP-binding protein [bacterium]RQV98544.1 MAG: ABC transporter ATP-binding protein [bacterium]
MKSPDIIVKTENLTRQFGRFTAVNQVSIRINRGEIFGFLGANGAGKTTLIRMLCGLLKPSSGEATVAGLDIKRESEKIKQKIGYMSQHFSLYNDLTVKENIEFYAGIYGLNRKQIFQKQNEISKQLQMEPYLDSRTSDLPLGLKQRLALATALLHNPPILFLDEPTSGVDPRARRSFWELIYQKAAQGTTIFVTTHFIDESEYCHRLSIMDNGRMIAIDTPESMKKRYKKKSMQEVFGFLIREKGI